MNDEDARDVKVYWGAVESLQRTHAEWKRQWQRTTAPLIEILKRHGGRFTFTDIDDKGQPYKRTLVLRQPPNDYNPVLLDKLCIDWWDSKGAGPFAQKVRQCQTVVHDPVVEEEIEP